MTLTRSSRWRSAGTIIFTRTATQRCRGRWLMPLMPRIRSRFVGAGNAGNTYVRIGPANSFGVTPAYQNNEQVYNLIYTYTKGPLIISPYYQYTVVKSDDSSRTSSPRRTHQRRGGPCQLRVQARVLAGRAAGVHQVERKRRNARSQLAGVRFRNRRVCIHRDPDLGEGRLLPSGGPLDRSPDELRHRGRWVWNRPARSPPTGSNTNQFRGAIEAGFMF